MAAETHTLEDLLGPVVEAAGYELVRLKLIGGSGTKTLQVMAEREDGLMDVDDCAALSRVLSEVLDAADPIADDYMLEVSSPGIDRPLTRKKDFVRYSGHDARIEMADGSAGKKRFKGVLLGLEGDDVVMDVPGMGGTERMRLSLARIADAKLVLTDRLIAEDLKAREKQKS